MKSYRNTAAAAALLLLPLLSCSEPQPPENVVVVVVVDTLRADGLSCYGNPLPTSPSLDALAREGVRFERAISASGWTLPSVASLLTGAWPSMHKALGKGVRLTPISDDLPTAAELLRERGFHTIAFANAAFVNPLQGMDRGFQVFDHYPAFNDRIRRAKETVEEALGRLAKHGGKDVFCFIHLFDPHLNYDPPPGYEDLFTEGLVPRSLPVSAVSIRREMCGGRKVDDPRHCTPSPEDVEWMKAAYHGEIRFVDDQIGLLIRGLKDLGLYDQATLVVTADHGEEFWEHGSFEHGHTLYDELVHVPLIVKLPAGREPKQKTVAAQVRVLDVMPTAFDLLGLEPPPTFVGASLLPLIDGTETEDREAWSEGTLYGADKYSFRDGRFKYVQDLADGSEELYDVRADPGETRNLIEASRKDAARMRAAFRGFWGRLQAESQAFRPGEPRDMSPKELEKYDEEIEKTGYGGRRGR